MEVILLYWFASLISWMAHKFNVGRFIWWYYLSLIGDPDHILAVRAVLHSSYEWCVQSAINTWSCVAPCVGIKLLLVCIANGYQKKWQTGGLHCRCCHSTVNQSPYVIFLCIAHKRCNLWNSNSEDVWTVCGFVDINIASLSFFSQYHFLLIDIAELWCWYGTQTFVGLLIVLVRTWTASVQLLWTIGNTNCILNID